MANIFLSHRGSDTELAERLAEVLRASGHQVWLDTWEIRVGDQIVEKITGGLEGATFLIVCYSSEGMSSWMTIEWTSALAAQLSGMGIKVLPARLSGAEAPGILIGTKYADLMADWDKGVRDLLRAVE